MKKIGLFTTIVLMFIMLTGCQQTTTYSLQFKNVNNVVVLNKSTQKEESLTGEQITAITEQLGKVTFVDSEEDLGDAYLYKVTMANGKAEETNEFYVYDATHIKMDDKFYSASENEIDVSLYEAVFQ